jgi:hypothetical protein
MSGTSARLEDGKSLASGIALSCLAAGQIRVRNENIATAMPAS